MPFRFYRRKSLRNGLWVGMGKRGPTVGRRGKRVSGSLSRRGPGVSVRLARGLSWFKRL
jgi:hypothetical protein